MQFDSVRLRCADAGEREGSRIVGRGRSDAEIAVETEGGSVVVDRLFARFVQLAPPSRGD